MSAEISKALNEFTKYLSQGDILKLKNYLNIPGGICQDPDPVEFLYQLTQWNRYNSNQFIAGLKCIRPILVVSALQIPWITTTRVVWEKNTTVMSQFIAIIRDHLEAKNWRVMLLAHGYHLTDCTNYTEIFRACLKTKIITNNLSVFIEDIEAIGRFDVVNMLIPFCKQFENWLPDKFIAEFKKETLTDNSELENWRRELIEYTCICFEKIEPILGSSVGVRLEEVYMPLAVIRYNTSENNLQEQESGKTEIDLLRVMHKKKIKTQDILETLIAYNPKTRMTWCLIGNPGCGKTWLCNRVALMFGKGHLPQIQFSISIPCRNQEWHVMEETRIDKGKPIDSQSLQDWLLLGMPIGASWTEDLAEHLVKAEGEGLLLVIDSIDEFTKSVPIEKTILSSLLRRQTFYKSSLLVTSRPAAWNQISSTLPDIKIDSHHQVLGFNPKNRDLYISKRLKARQLKLFKHMLALHEEISLLCLIPVNASLFTALFQLSDAVATSTLTQLYSHLFLYLIRRQLSRMKLTRYTKVEQLFQLNESVLQCLYSIGEVAYKGVSVRELTSTSRFRLRIVGEKEQDSECLGLVQVQLKETEPGVKMEVWSFSHLTLQEFTAALYLSSIHWRHLCILTRFIVSTREVFDIYRMVIRFSCGLLSDNATCHLPIVFRHQLTAPLPFSDVPLIYQLDYASRIRQEDFSKLSGWYEFTTEFVSLTTLIAESNFKPLYPYISDSLQDNLCFYFHQTVPLNDWNNFVASLPYISKTIQVIQIDLQHFTITQLHTLLRQLPSCCVRYLALKHNIRGFAKFKHTIIRAFPLSTRLSIEVLSGGLSVDCPLMDIIALSNQTLSSLCLSADSLKQDVIQKLTGALSFLQCFLYFDHCSCSTKLLSCMLVQGRSSLDRLQSLHLCFAFHISQRPAEYEIMSAIGRLTALREISCNILFLPHIILMSQLSYLKIHPPTFDAGTIFQYSHYLLGLLDQNRCTLKNLIISRLHCIGFQELSPLLSVIHRCTALLELQLIDSEFLGTPRTSSLALPESLVLLKLYDMKLGDSGLSTLFELMAFHPAIRRLEIRCLKTFVCCKHLCNLIQTLPNLRELSLQKPGWFGTNQLTLLERTTSKNCIKLDYY